MQEATITLKCSVKECGRLFTASYSGHASKFFKDITEHGGCWKEVSDDFGTQFQYLCPAHKGCLGES